MGESVCSYLDGRVVLHPGDCRERIRAIPDASIDAVVTDPPYALVSIGKRFGKPGAAPAKAGTDGLYARASAGFMGQQWDTGETAFAVEFWAEVLRVLKPGGHLAAFSGTRTYHRMTVAIEDAGFEIRDQLGWAYGSGFPKSHDVSKGIDRAAGAERVPIAFKRKLQSYGANDVYGGGPDKGGFQAVTNPATEEAIRWGGWGTALKPAWEPIVLARKPLIGTVAENVLEHGPGALNIDGCRIGFAGADDEAESKGKNRHADFGNGPRENSVLGKDNRDRGANGNYDPIGRWPANILHDGSDEIVAVFGEASRFFYSAKADADDRIGSKHPTVKPVDVMRWLCRLVTPPGGTILDPFAGTGTTGEAAFHEGFRAILIEREEAYQADIARRMELAVAGPMTRRVESIKARGRAAPADDLFTSMTEAAE
jgi:DNA modification methylase